MQLGLNIDPNHGFSVQDVLDTNAEFVRFPFWWQTGFNYKLWCDTLQARGVEPMAVLDKRAFMFDDKSSIITRMNRLREKLPALYYWQIGNEPDGTEESSWSMPKLRFSRYLQAGVKAFAGRYVIAGGLVSGDTNWLRGVDISLIDAIAVHPYAQTPTSALQLLDSYSRWNKPIVVSEFGGQDELFNDAHERAVYHTDIMRNFSSHPLVGMASVFCFSDKMVPGFGLVNAAGESKEVYAAFRDAIPIE